MANFDKMVSSKCPADILAARRIPNDMARVAYLIDSINTKNGVSIKGQPWGVKILRNCLLCFFMALNVLFIIIVNESLNVIIIWEVVVNTYGSSPIKFIVVNTVNILNIRGLYVNCFDCMCSLVKLLVVVNNICEIIEFRLGSIFCLLFMVVISSIMSINVSVRFLILIILSLNFMYSIFFKLNWSK